MGATSDKPVNNVVPVTGENVMARFRELGLDPFCPNAELFIKGLVRNRELVSVIDILNGEWAMIHSLSLGITYSKKFCNGTET